MKGLFCAATAGMFLTTSLLSAPIKGLFNTGVKDDGTILGNEEKDSHYTLVESADEEYPGPDVFTLTPGFPVGPWLAEGPNSRWIGPRPQQGTGNNEGNYTYRITFDLTGFDPATAAIQGQWSTDNTGVDILINGTSTGQANSAQFASWTPFTVTGGFMAGTNTLDFALNNAPSGINPTGLRVELTGTVLAPGTPPSVKTQPVSQSVPIGDTLSFTVAAEGSAPLSYQWRFNSIEIANETNSTLTLVNVGTNRIGNYDVVVRNSAGSTNSAAATLSVLDRVPGLFDTGVSAPGAVLADAAVDPHYKLVTNPDGPSIDAVVHDSTVFPIVGGPWAQNSDSSKWISPRVDTQGAAGGVYVYRTTLDLTGFDPTTAVLLGNWGADNDQGQTEILLNGLSTKLISAPFNTLTPFVITNNSTVQFFPGTNTLEFRVENQGAGYTGLRVENLRAGAKSGVILEPPPHLRVELFSAVSIGGFVGKTYKIEFAPDRTSTSYTMLTNIVLPSDPFLFVDLTSSNAPERAYRVTAQ